MAHRSVNNQQTKEQLFTLVHSRGGNLFSILEGQKHVIYCISAGEPPIIGFNTLFINMHFLIYQQCLEKLPQLIQTQPMVMKQILQYLNKIFHK